MRVLRHHRPSALPPPVTRWAIGLMTLAVTFTARAATIEVAPSGAGAYATIQAAVNGAQPGDVIELLDGTFHGPGNRDIDYLGKAITIRSRSGQASLCVVDCGGQPMTPHRGFLFQSGEGTGSVLQDVRVESAHFWAEGGAVLCTAASPTLLRVEFADNYSNFGGGLACLNGANPQVQGCTFMGNLSDFGSAAACRGSSPQIVDCRFVDNLTAEIGGGLLCEQNSNPTIERCSFETNRAEVGAGMACRDASNPKVFQTRFVQNSAHEAGAVWCANSSPVFTECLFAANEASERGGALLCVFAAPQLSRCTLYGNHAPVAAGIFAWLDSAPVVESTIIAFSPQGEAVACTDGGTATLSCSDVYGNAGGDWSGSIAAQMAGDGNFGADPRFCDTSTGVLHLWANSPCLPGNHPGGATCGVIGAFGFACTPVRVESTTWGQLKSLYRGGR